MCLQNKQIKKKKNTLRRSKSSIGNRLRYGSYFGTIKAGISRNCDKDSNVESGQQEQMGNVRTEWKFKEKHQEEMLEIKKKITE